jgi:hypothetical protein
MCDRGLFKLDYRLSIDSAWQSSTTRLSLCLQSLNYAQEFGSTQTSVSCFLSISGFPRKLCAQDNISSPRPENINHEQHAGLTGWDSPSSTPAIVHAKTEPNGLQLQSSRSRIPPRRLMSDPQMLITSGQIPQSGNYGDKWLDDDGHHIEVDSTDRDAGCGV